jgi:hypothetical protein
MLTKATFAKWMATLHARFARAENQHVINLYYDTLKHLTDTDFERAARIIFDEDAFWPPPARFRDAARGGNPNELANAEWERLLAACRAGNSDISYLTPAGVTAMRAAGGWRAIAYAESDTKLSAAKRAFTSAWIDASNQTTPALPNARRGELPS